MSDTRALLNRITSFRQKLEQTPNLIPVGVPIEDLDSARARTTATLANSPELIVRSLRDLAGVPVNEGPLPSMLTVRARRLLEEARGLVAFQRRLTDEPLLTGLMISAGTEIGNNDPDALVTYVRETVSLTDAALRMIQALPASTDTQLKVCDGVEAMLRAVRDRLAVSRAALNERKKSTERIDGLAKQLFTLSTGRSVELNWFANLAEQLLEESRQALPIRFLCVSPLSEYAYPGAERLPAPARFIAAHALTVAQVLARVAPQDYEWASRPIIPLIAAFVMDVGMLKVPCEILAKCTELTADDRRILDTHPVWGAELIRHAIPELGPVVSAIASHHERPDGTGYPAGLSGDQIPSLARLLAVCDTYAAMACDRPHRSGKDPRTTLTDTLLAAEQGRLDWDLSELMLSLAFHPVGTVVELTDGRVGVVAANHVNRGNLRLTARPVVAVLTDVTGAVLPRPHFVDLAAAERGGVVRVLSLHERTRLLAKYYPELCA